MQHSLRHLLAGLAVLACALHAPTAGAQDWLRVLNPKQPWNAIQGTIEEATLSVQPKGVYMEHHLYLTFSARGGFFGRNDSLEVEMFFGLPEDAVVTDSWLWFGDVILRAKIMDQWTASDIYEDIVSRQRDPSILFKRGQGRYELRVYPMKPAERRKVMITYLVPARWTETAVSSPLPLGLFNASANPLPGVKLITWTNGTWKNARVPELPNLAFKGVTTDAFYGPHMEATLDANTFYQPEIRFAVDAPLKNGLFLSLSPDSTEGYYQMAFVPSKALQMTAARKLAALIDYDASKTSYSQDDLLTRTRAALTAELAPTDSFNLIVSRLSPHRVSNRWMPAHPDTIAAAFASLKSTPLALYSNLAPLLKNGVEFAAQAGGGGGSLLLVSASDQYGEASIANQLIQDLKAINGNLPPVYTADVANRNYSSHFIGGRYYSGNEYFYTNLSKLTGGDVRALRSDSSALADALAELVGAVSGVITTMDLHTTLASGFAYGRFTEQTGESVATNRPIIQVGRTYGRTPFVLEVSGLYKTTPFSVRREIAHAEAYRSDTTLASWWHGKQILALERSSQTNDNVGQIVNYSLDYRILSLYTAFLALEPSMGGEVCVGCDGTPDDVGTGAEEELPQEGKTTIKAYPNPFSTLVTLEVHFAEPTDARQVKVEIFNALGQRVAVLTVSESGMVQDLRLTWDGVADSGDPVANGAYFCVVTTPAGKFTTTLIVVR